MVHFIPSYCVVVSKESQESFQPTLVPGHSGWQPGEQQKRKGDLIALSMGCKGQEMESSCYSLDTRCLPKSSLLMEKYPEVKLLDYESYNLIGPYQLDWTTWVVTMSRWSMAGGG